MDDLSLFGFFVKPESKMERLVLFPSESNMEDLSCENLSRLVKIPDLLSRLLALRLDGGEKNVSFQWLGPHFLTFLKYVKELLRCFYPDCCRPFTMHNPCCLLKRLDDSAFDCILYEEIFSYHDNEHYKIFLQIVLTSMPKLNEFFTIQTSITNNFKVNKNWEIFTEFLFETIRELLSCHKDSTVLVSNQLEFLQKGLKFLLTFIFYPIPSYDEEQKKSIFTEIEAVFNEAGLFLHSFFFTTDLVTTPKMDLAIFGLLERIEIVLVKIKYYSIAVSSEVGIGSLQVADSPSEVSSSQGNGSPMVEEIVVGLEDTTTQIVSKLVGGPKYRQIISIVGMGGLGKTTSAKKIYNDPSVRYYFDKLSWCAVSQTYNKRKLLIDILSSSRDLDKETMLKKEDEELAELLYKSLKGKRYLIVVDDLWEKESWDDLKRLFPDDSNGSRVMITSRLKNVASEISHVIIEPPPLSPEESWKLLEQKVFKKECCPQELQDIGKKIAANCKGLPLSVVLIAGILSNIQKKESLWQQVAKSLSYYISQKADDYIPTLKLSYIHLPDHLKPCFLYLSAFQEDEEIPVRKLLLLWIVEGFIEKREQKTLEDVAEEYLMELVNRSLLQVSERRSDNGVKVCTLHDLVLDMCSKMVGEDENFLFQHQFLVSKHRRLHHLYMGQFHRVLISENIFEAFSIAYNLEKIRIVDSSNDKNVLQGINFMLDVRYLKISELEPSIGKLHNLEYLCLLHIDEVPTYLLNMPKLRHLRVGGCYNGAIFTKNSDSFRINCLQTLGFVEIVNLEDEEILRCSPNLRMLKCYSIDNYFPDLSFFTQLQTLTIAGELLRRAYSMVKFPMNIKKLTLISFGFPWEEMSLIGTLPNLEILKLERNSFSGKIWDTKDDEFQKLKFLKLDSLDLEQWNLSHNHFPVLERLVLVDCECLGKIPSEFSNISTLQRIELLFCGEDVETSALEIRQEQLDYGNTEFDVTNYSDWL
ncbi:putative late blight resistance protein homolog R1A-10 [Olea europaea var. sylvestris]|uniref:putative late blight resistance protein homolog R1A-10 n=1 Tax=Olea europaea var. sylvestris TaxID=158386 RepID=UPI000C1D00F9|nr:putative late blight resistance protein homolog R1A-10 [Olea europaea var. sylvestris]XP_022846866.1 putative late blight resistance protein homolog R1A-10 [Olea europaea var. sylvestris]